MKICQWMIVVLLAQGRSCGIIDDVDDAYNIVKDKFRNFLSEVREDVTLDVDCTIFAVEQLILSDDDEYRERCLQQAYSTVDEYAADPVYAQSGTPSAPEQYTKSYNVNEKHNLLDKLVHKNIDSTASQLNNKLKNDIKDNNIHSKLEIIKNSFNKESQHLQDVDSYLRHKIDSLDMNINIEKPSIATNISPFEDIWSNLHVLHETKNPIITEDAKVKEIDNVVNAIMAIIPTNGTDASGKNKIDTMIDQLAKNINVITKPVKQSKIDVSIENKLIGSKDQSTIKIPNLLNQETHVKRQAVESKKNEVYSSLNTVEEMLKPQATQNNTFEELVKSQGVSSNLNTLRNAVENLINPVSEESKKYIFGDTPFSAVEDLIKPQTIQYADNLNAPAKTVEEIINSQAGNNGIFSNSQPSAVEQLIKPQTIDGNKAGLSNVNTPNNPLDNLINTPTNAVVESKNPVENLIKSQSAEINAPFNAMENIIQPKSANGRKEIFSAINTPPSNSVDNLLKPQAIEYKKDMFSNVNTPMNAVEDLIKPQAVESEKDMFSDYFDDLSSDFDGDTTAAPVARSDEARNIIKEYQASQSIINKYFDNPKYVVDDFDSNNPNSDDDLYNDDLFANF